MTGQMSREHSEGSYRSAPEGHTMAMWENEGQGKIHLCREATRPSCEKRGDQRGQVLGLDIREEWLFCVLHLLPSDPDSVPDAVSGGRRINETQNKATTMRDLHNFLPATNENWVGDDPGTACARGQRPSAAQAAGLRRGQSPLECVPSV